MKNMNISSPTAMKILSAWEKEGRAERARTYLGASIIGHECDMYLWLNFRGVVHELFDGRMYRLFDRGKREEAVFINDLRRIGCEVKEFDENGNQWGISALGGHFSGHLDGLAKGLDEAPKQWFVTEFKTHSDSSFKKLCKEGVAKAKPMHYAQMQTYMGHTGLKKALYMAVDKDTDDLWCEIVDFNKTAFDLIMTRAKHIIDTVQPDRCASRPDDYRCKMCPCAKMCWHEASQFIDPLLPETCRTCCHATADTEHQGAIWVCRKGKSCTTCGHCEDYLPLPVFVKGEAVDGDENNIVYSFEVNGKTDGITIGKRGVSVAEAKKFGPEEAREIKMIKEEIPGAIVVANNRLENRCNSELEIYFEGDQESLMKKYDNIDMTKPLSSEERGSKTYFEYAGNWVVCFDSVSGRISLFGEKMPF